MFFRRNKDSSSSPCSRLKEAEKLPDSKREEFKNYTREYLQSDNWKIRNVGVKLVGMLGFKEMIPELIKMLIDRTPDKFLNRLLGGDFVQVGFIRRNCIRSLIMLKESNREITEALHKALDDPYWEVRAEAVNAIAKLISKNALSDIEKKLIELLNDKRFEVVLSSVESLGLIARNREVLKHLRRLYYYPNQKVKMMLIKSLHNLFARGIITDEKELRDELNQIFIPISIKNYRGGR